MTGFRNVVRRHAVDVSSRFLRRIYPAHPKSDPELYAPHGLRRIPHLFITPKTVEADLARACGNRASPTAPQVGAAMGRPPVPNPISQIRQAFEASQDHRLTAAARL
ncbi:hypothetical protein [Micromonospora sp. NPDC050200]|uniref:hypothetical protein n=1 Tax=Micromonospora sp. NPDC050200 TaxID=3155664 RepID=UPI0033C74E70